MITKSTGSNLLLLFQGIPQWDHSGEMASPVPVTQAPQDRSSPSLQMGTLTQTLYHQGSHTCRGAPVALPFTPGSGTELLRSPEGFVEVPGLAPPRRPSACAPSLASSDGCTEGSRRFSSHRGGRLPPSDPLSLAWSRGVLPPLCCSA